MTQLQIRESSAKCLIMEVDENGNEKQYDNYISLNYQQLENIEEINSKHFKDNARPNIERACLGNDTLFITFYPFRSVSECANNIAGNAPIKLCFTLRQYGNNYTLETLSRSYRTKPTSPYMYNSSKSPLFRKVKADNWEKISQAIDKYITKFMAELLEDYKNDNIMTCDLDMLNAHIRAIRG